MKLFLIAAVATFASIYALPSSAADLRRPLPAPAAAVYTPAYNWSGLYAGINGGGGWGRSSWSGADSFSLSGGMVGGTLGYNWQVGQVVYGLEGDIDWSNLRGTTTTFCPGGCETRNDWLGTVRGRLGLAYDRFLPYVTGGLAVGNIRASNVFGSTDTTRAGWTVGGGVEFALAGNWTAKVEYLHVDLGSMDCNFSCGFPATNNVSFQADVIRGGLNYRF